MRIVIVDDEQIVLRGLQTIIDRAGRDWTVVAQCTSAEEALPVIDAMEPDVVISDIRMCGLSGIGLAEQILKRHKDILVILLSGYAEFDYAQQAIQLTVFDYLLKPTRYTQIINCLTRAEQQLQLRQEEKETIAAQVAQSQFLMRDKFLNDLMKGLLPVSTDLAEKTKEYGLCFDRCMVFRFACSGGADSFGADGKDRFLLDYGIKNVILEILSPLENIILLSESVGHFTMIGGMGTQKGGKEWLEPLLSKAAKAIEDIFKLHVMIGVSPETDGVDALFDSYNRAGYACENTQQAGRQVVFFEDLEYTPPYEAYPESIRGVLEFIDDNYQNSITLQQAAEKVFLNVWYLSDLFKREVGVTFSEYVQNKRIEKARQLLRETPMKLYEVSYAVGIKEQAYFSSVFKKATGMTPRKYREQYN